MFLNKNNDCKVFTIKIIHSDHLIYDLVIDVCTDGVNTL